VLLTGDDPIELDQIGLGIACAAMRRRKAVLVLDLAAAGANRSASVCEQLAGLAERVGVPVTCVGSVPRAPAARAPAARAQPRPGAGAVPGAGTIGAVSLNGAFGRAIRARGVVLVPARQPDAAQSEATLHQPAQQAVGDLADTLTSLRELGLRGDCLAWVSGCEAADASLLSDLLALGHATGTAVVLTVTDPGLAADLAAEAGVVVASGPIASNLAQRLAALGAMGHELPIDAPLRASIGSRRPSGLESAAELVAAKLALTDVLRGQHRNSATLIAGDVSSAPASFRIVPVEVTEVR
jgi:hypothetical protein